MSDSIAAHATTSRETVKTASGDAAPSDVTTLSHIDADDAHVQTERSPRSKRTKKFDTKQSTRSHTTTANEIATANDVTTASDSTTAAKSPDDSATRRSSRTRRRPGFYGVPVHDYENLF